MLTENMKLKENNEHIINQNFARAKRISELEEILINQESAISTLTENESYLKTNISTLEKDVFKLNE